MVHLPMGRFGEAIEIARGALFRASPLPPSIDYPSTSLLTMTFLQWLATTRPT